MPGKSPASDRCTVSFPSISILTFESHYEEEKGRKALRNYRTFAILCKQPLRVAAEGESDVSRSHSKRETRQKGTPSSGEITKCRISNCPGKAPAGAYTLANAVERAVGVTTE